MANKLLHPNKVVKQIYRTKEKSVLRREKYLLYTTYMGINNLLTKIELYYKYYIVYEKNLENCHFNTIQYNWSH